MSLALVALRTAAQALVFLSILLGAHTIAAAPSTPASPLGIRGLRRVRALRKNEFFARVEPLLRWLGVRLAPLLGKGARAELDRQIMLAGDFWGLQPEELVALSMISAVFGAAFGLALVGLLDKGPIYPFVGALVGGGLPFMEIFGIQQERSKRFQNGLPYVIDLLALALSAGLDFPGAILQVVEKSSNPDDPLIEELNLLLSELQVGKTRKSALAGLAARAPSESVREFVGAAIQAEERGNPLGHILQIQAEGSRRKRSVRAEEAAAKASVKIMMPLMLAFVAVLLLIAAPMALELERTFNSE